MYSLPGGNCQRSVLHQSNLNIFNHMKSHTQKKVLYNERIFLACNLQAHTCSLLIHKFWLNMTFGVSDSYSPVVMDYNNHNSNCCNPVSVDGLQSKVTC